MTQRVETITMMYHLTQPSTIFMPSTTPSDVTQPQRPVQLKLKGGWLQTRNGNTRDVEHLDRQSRK